LGAFQPNRVNSQNPLKGSAMVMRLPAILALAWGMLALLLFNVEVSHSIEIGLEPDTRLTFQLDSTGHPQMLGKTHSAAYARVGYKIGVTVIGIRPDGNWLCEMEVDEAYMYTEGGSRAELEDLAEELSSPFYFVQNPNGNIVSVSKNEDDEPGLYEMKKRLVSMLHMSLPPQEKVEDQSWYHAAETEIQGDIIASYLVNVDASNTADEGMMTISRSVPVKHQEVATTHTKDEYRVFANNGTIHSASGVFTTVMDASAETPDLGKRTIHEINYNLQLMHVKKIDPHSVSESSRKLLSAEDDEVMETIVQNHDDHINQEDT